MYQFILVRHEQEISTITLNRPNKRNALHGQMLKELCHALENIIIENQTRVLKICAHGSHFCAGADIYWMKNSVDEDTVSDATSHDLAAFLYQLYHFPAPTMAVVQGPA